MKISTKTKSEIPTLYIFCGIPGSGKTTLAKHLEDSYRFIRIATDDIKLLYLQYNFNYSIKDLFSIQYHLIEQFLYLKYSVIADSNSDKNLYRKFLQNIAIKTKSNYKTIYCDVSIDVARYRMKIRQQNTSTSKNFYVNEARLQKYAAELEKPYGAVTVNTNKSTIEESCSILDCLLNL